MTPGNKFMRMRHLRALLITKATVAAILLSSVPALAQGAGYWHTSGSQILDSNNQRVRIAGVNWYGFETTRAVAGGLTSQDYKAVLQTIKTNGYNVVRIPFSNQMAETPSTNLNISYYNSSGPINTDLQGLNSLQVLDKIVAQAGTIGLRIILDNHRSEAGDSAEANGLWYTSSYPESAWINDWTNLASRYLNNPTVIGFDLRNEPHNAYSGGACWDCGGANDWHLAAAHAGNSVLAVNPKLLIFVEGVDAYNYDYYWWGGNLQGVRNSPVMLSVANQLVYSAHDYGPREYGQSWFNSNTTYSSLATVWNNHWAFIVQNNIAPVWLGEFGTTNTNSDIQNNAPGSQGQWFQSMVQYLSADAYLSWTYWALNGEDNYGLLDSNYNSAPANGLKQQSLASIQSPLAGGTTANPPSAASGLTANAVSESQINLAWTASSTSGVTYTVFLGTSSGATNTVAASNVSGTTYSVTALNPSTNYYFTVKAVNSGGTSASSNTANATTLASSGPNAPSSLSANASSSSQIGLSWTASSSSGVTYTVYSGTSTGATSTLVASGVSGTAYSVIGLNPSTTYYFVVKAAAAGRTSAASNQASATTGAAAATGTCHISYVNQNDWRSGFTGNLSITSSAAISSWKVTWSYAGNQLLNQSWNGNYVQSGNTVTITNASYNGTIGAGSTISGIGFNATYSGSNTNPSTFYLNGVACQ